ncbi:MAG: hypothetical protein ACXAD7_26035, partial [Candidatus Kariarchaeaceae archaeon]
VKPLSNTNGYGVIFAVKSLQEIPRDITIQDVLSSTIEVSEVHLDAGEIAQATAGKSKTILWKVGEISQNETVSAYLKYMGEGKYDIKNLNVYSQEKEIQGDQEGQGMTIHKRETIIMPPIFQDEIDI